VNKGLRRAEKQLHERLKELQYLYHISSIIETGVDPSTVLQEAAGHAHKALHFPDKAFCCIRFDDAEYHTERCPKRAINRQISADIKVGGAVRGAVTLGYADDIEFLPEEKQLPAEIARMLSSALERSKAEQELKCYVDSLEEQLAKRTTEGALTRKHFEDLVMYAPDAVVISRDNGDIVTANPSFYRMLQYPEDGSLILNFVKDKL